jgi:hypothetical protein
MTESDPTTESAPGTEPDPFAGSAGREPTEEELRAALEQELKRIRVSDVVIQTIVTLVNLAGRRLALAPGSEDELDLDQARQAIDAVRALVPIVERSEGENLKPVKDALSQLQMAYARASGDRPPGGPPPESGGTDDQGGSGDEGGPGPAQSSGRLWVPGS